MRSTFFGLEIAKTGLFISQKGLDVTGHNIANVDTLGYTRQRLITSANDPYNAITKIRPMEQGLVGAGVHVRILDQIRDVFLDRQFRYEQTELSYWASRNQGLSYVATFYDEGDDGSSLRNSIQNLASSFNQLSHNSDLDQRTYVREQAITLTANFRKAHESLMQLQESQNNAVKTVVDKINTISKQIAELNKSIHNYEIDGQPANDLRDKRNLLLDQLSAYIDVEYSTDNNGYLSVKAAGCEIVNHVNTQDLEVALQDNPLGSNYPQTYKIMFNGTEVKNVGGELGARWEICNSDDAETPGIPHFINQLNKLVQNLVEQVNAVHANGWTHPGNADPDGSEQGIPFFDPNGITADTFDISDELKKSPYYIAASLAEIDMASSNDPKAGDQQNALALYELFTSTNLPNGIGNFNKFMSSLVTEVSTTWNHADTMQSTCTDKTLAVDNQRLSVSGVSLDEEMTNMMKYQHAYSGASRVITAMDEALDTVINRMGLVGRS